MIISSNCSETLRYHKYLETNKQTNKQSKHLIRDKTAAQQPFLLGILIERGEGIAKQEVPF